MSVIISLDKQQLTLYSGDTADRAFAGFDRRARPPDPDRRVQRHPEGSLAPLQHLQQCPDVLHAADHLVRRGDASGRTCRTMPASHGCIRLPEAFAKQMWGITKMGARVIVARPRDSRLSAISNPKLFVFKAPPEPPKPPEAWLAANDRRRHGRRDREGGLQFARDSHARPPTPRPTQRVTATDATECRSGARGGGQAAQARPDLGVHQPQGRQDLRAQGLRAGVRRAGDVRAARSAARHPRVHRALVQ